MREGIAFASNFKFSDCRLDDCSLIDETVPIKVGLRSDVVVIPRIVLDNTDTTMTTFFKSVCYKLNWVSAPARGA